MKATIDQAEAFLEGITNAWARVMIFFVTCWGAHLWGSAAAHFEWIVRHSFNDQHGLAWGGPRIGYEIYLLPAVWLQGLLFGTLDVFGIPVVLALIGLAYAMVFTDTPRLPLILFVLLIQSWWTWYCEVNRYYLRKMFDGEEDTPLPGVILMLFMTALATYLSRLHWYKQREEGDL